jgi:hypothetical protein
VSPDWFDPLGLRGSKLDPFTMFADALKGEGLAQQSVEAMAATVVRRIVGRRVEIERDPPVSATVERIHEATLPTARASIPSTFGEVPMWQQLRGRIRDVTIGDRTLQAVEMTVTGVRLAGTTAQRLSVERVEFNATIEPGEAERWAAEIEGTHVVRVRDGRLEATDRRVARWAWLEVAVTAAGGVVVVTPIALRILGRIMPMPNRLRRSVERRAPWLPADLVVREVRVTGPAIGVRGELENVRIPVDVTRVLTEIGALGTKSVLRIVLGDR